MDAMKEFYGIFMEAMQEFYQRSLLFHGAFMQLRKELYADFFCLFVFNFLCIFFQLIPERRFLEVCTSSYHALTCDYREFHAYIAFCGCGGSLGCSESRGSRC